MTDQIIRILIVLASGLIGSIGFALIFGVAKKHFLFSVISSIISCLAFEIIFACGGGMFVSALVGAGLSAAYSDIISHKIKTPATVMIIIGIIPLVPGAKLYYTMLGIVRDDMEMFSHNGESALLIAAGIAVGIISVTAISKPIKAKLSELNSKINEFNHKNKKTKENKKCQP